MSGFDIRLELELFQNFCTDRSDRADHDTFESATERIVHFVVCRHPEQVIHLICVGKERDIRLALQNLPNRLTKRRQILGQRPAIDRDRYDCGSSILQLGDEFLIGDAIFLNRNSLAADIECGIEGG